MQKWKLNKRIKVRKSFLAIASILLAVSGIIAIVAQTINNPSSPNLLLGEGFQLEAQNSAIFTAGRSFYVANYTFINSSPNQKNSVQISRNDANNVLQKYWINSTSNAAVTLLNWFDTFGLDIKVATVTNTTTMVNYRTMSNSNNCINANANICGSNIVSGLGAITVLPTSNIVKFGCTTGPCEFRVHWNIAGGTVQLINPQTAVCNTWCRIAPMGTTFAVFNVTIWDTSGTVFRNATLALAYLSTTPIQHEFDINILRQPSNPLGAAISATDVGGSRWFAFNSGTLSTSKGSTSGVYYTIQIKILIVGAGYTYPDYRAFEQTNVRVVTSTTVTLNNIQPRIYEVEKFSPSVGKTNGSNATQAGPVLAYPMDTAVSAPNTNWVDVNRILDTTQFHNDGVLCNGSTVPTYMLGANGGAELFSGNQCWSIADTAGTVTDATLHADSLGNYLTISAWTRIDQVPASGPGYIIDKSGEYSLSMDSVGRFEFSVGSNVIVGNTTILLGNYYYVTGVWNATHAILYVGAIPDGNWTSLSAVPSHNTNPIVVGCQSAITSCFTGMIDELYVYKRPLGQIEIINLVSQSNTNRPTDNFYPSSTTGTTTCPPASNGACYLFNNPELPSAYAQDNVITTTDINTTNYILAPSTWHEVVNLTYTGDANFCGVGGFPPRVLGNTLGFGGAFVCDEYRFSWDLFYHGVFQSSYGIILSFTGTYGVNAGCANDIICGLALRIYRQSNNVVNYENIIGNSTAVSATPGQGFVNVGIDIWLSSDQSRLGIRISNYNQGSGNSGTATFNRWTAHPLRTLQGEFFEQLVSIQDITGTPRNIGYFDPIVRQNSELWTQTCQIGSCGGAPAANSNIAIAGHRDQIQEQLACIVGGYILPAAIGALVGASGIVTGPVGVAAAIIAGAGAAILLQPIFCPNRGGIEPSLPSSCSTFNVNPSFCTSSTSGGSGTGCGVFQGVCAAISTLAGNIANPIVGGLGAAFVTALNGIVNILASSIANALGGAWVVFVSSMDNVIALLTAGRVTNGFTTFWAVVAGPNGVFSFFIRIINPLLLGIFVFLTDTPVIFATLIQFFAGGGVDFMNIIYIVMTTLFAVNCSAPQTAIGGCALNTMLSGTINFFLAFFGKGQGPNGTQFTGPGGITYDWGPAGQLMSQLTFLYAILIGIWYLKKFISAPWDTTMETFRILQYFTALMSVTVGFLFNMFMKIVSWFKSLVPTWGSSWS